MAADRMTPHRCTVLVVDDDADARELLRLSLSAEGFKVAAVANGREALHHLRSHEETCIILLDLMLPVMDGVHFRTVQLRDRSLAWIPLVVMSAAVDADRRARELGARRFIQKPLDLDEVRDVLMDVGCPQAQPRAARAAISLAGR